jgi:hypothetical protein
MQGNISYSSATGDLSGSTTSYYQGGLAGVGYKGDIINSYATGNVTGKFGIGGLVANFSNGDIINCYAMGNLSITVFGSSYFMGGLVGFTGVAGVVSNVNIIDSYAAPQRIVTSCFNAGCCETGGLFGVKGSSFSYISSYYDSDNLTCSCCRTMGSESWAHMIDTVWLTAQGWSFNDANWSTVYHNTYYPPLSFQNITVGGADRYWVGTGSTNWNNINNWAYTSGGAGGAGVPGFGNDVYFDSGNGNCTIDANVNIKSLSISPGYTGDFNASSYDITVSDNVTFAGSANFYLGSSFWAIGGDFNYSEIFNQDHYNSTFYAETSVIKMTGSGKRIIGDRAHDLRTLWITGDISIPSYYPSVTDFVDIRGNLTLDGSIDVPCCGYNDNDQFLRATESVIDINSGGILTGSGSFVTTRNVSITNLDGVFNISNVVLRANFPSLFPPKI